MLGVHAVGSAKRQLARFRLGLIPSWAKDPAIAYKLINARSETVAEKPAYRAAFKARRCLIPVDGFYEWKREGRGKVPFFLQMRDERLFSLAGLWEWWRPKEGKAVESCTVITTEPNDVLRPIHDRMPVIVSPTDFERWLDPMNQNVDELKSLLRPYPPDEMTARQVSRHVNNPRNNGPECIQAIDVRQAIKGVQNACKRVK